MKALSVRQPWAWLIVNGHKDIENRNWRSDYRGPLLIHASKGMTQAEYREGANFAHRRGVLVPLFHSLERGGIVGQVTMTGCVAASDSLWFMAEYGFTLADAKPLKFRAMNGQLGFFEVPL